MNIDTVNLEDLFPLNVGHFQGRLASTTLVPVCFCYGKSPYSTGTVPSGNQTWHAGKSPIYILIENPLFYIGVLPLPAMFDFQRVSSITNHESTSHQNEPLLIIYYHPRSIGNSSKPGPADQLCSQDRRAAGLLPIAQAPLRER